VPAHSAGKGYEGFCLPWCPIVSFVVTMHRIYLALGTNLGERVDNLRRAIAALSPTVRVTALSQVYETPPWGYTDQPAFLNMALAGETENDPLALIVFLKDLEVELGREKSFRNGPRLIDIDILFFDDLRIDEPGLAIPHPRLHERAFVLVPLNDIAPDLIHPELGRAVRDLLKDVDTKGVNFYGHLN
jgi:2-amino-4-hydroxy-6-hydroxymethyldihydropteridine diphosphokinase